MGCTNSSIDDLEIGEPFDNQAAITGQWDLVEVRYVDNLDIRTPKRFTDVTSFFNESAATIEFEATSFTYTHGSGPNFLGNSGNWAFDDAAFPEAVVLNANTTLKLKEPVRSFSESLILILERKCEDKTISSYEYHFNRRQQS